MILHGAVADNAWSYYADQVRRDPTNVYCCSRLLDHSHRVAMTPDGDALLRSATLTLFRADPFAYVTTMSTQLLWSLPDEDLSEISEGLDRAGDQDTTNFLRGKLWSDVAQGRKDPAPLARRAHDYLVQVSEDAAAREPEYWPAIAECYRVTDYAMFTQALPKALESQEPGWRAQDLLHGLEEAVKHEDWKTYAQWRELWDALPQNAHVCECYVNRVFNYDGLAALQAGNMAVIPELLRRALDVRGCAHLNSGGPDMDLAEALIDRGVLLGDAEAYLDSSAQLFGDNRHFTRVRERLSVARGASTHSTTGRDDGQ